MRGAKDEDNDTGDEGGEAEILMEGKKKKMI